MDRCPWAKTDLYVQYHDSEWGVPVHDDRLLSGRPYAIAFASSAPRFVCEPQAAREVD